MRLLHSSRRILPFLTRSRTFFQQDAIINEIFCDNFQLFASAVDNLTPVKGMGYLYKPGENDSPKSYIGYDLCGASCWVFAWLLQRQGIEVSLGGTRKHVYLMSKNERGEPSIVCPTYKQFLVDIPDCNESTIYGLPPVYIGSQRDLRKDFSYIVSVVRDGESTEKNRSMDQHYAVSLEQKYYSDSRSLFPLDLKDLLADNKVTTCPIIADVVDMLRDFENPKLPDNLV